MKQDSKTGRILPKLTPEQKRQMLEDYDAGATLTEVSKKYGINVSSAFYNIDRAGLMRKKVRVLNGEDSIDVCRLYRSGCSINKIGRMKAVDPSTVWECLKACGEEIRDQSARARLYPLDETAFDVANEEVAYWVGMLMADGCVTIRKKGTHCLTLALAERDAAHVEKFQRFLKTTNPIRILDNNRNGSTCRQNLHSLTVTSKPICQRLMGYGVVPRKSKGATVCDPFAMDRHFWRGMVDGDGCVKVYKGNNPHLGLVGSLPLMEQYVAFVHTKLGYSINLYKHGNVYYANLGSRRAIAAAKLLYDDSTVFLERKYQNYLKVVASRPTAP